MIIAFTKPIKGLNDFPTIAVDHGEGIDGKKIIALYCHLGKMLVSAGDKIQRGEVIAYLGNNYHEYECIWGSDLCIFRLEERTETNTPRAITGDGHIS